MPCLFRAIRSPHRSPQDNETKMFYEIVIAPGYTPEGLEILKGAVQAEAASCCSHPA